MMDMFSGIGGFLMRVFLGLLSLIFSHGIFLAMHELGYFPERTLARLFISYPTLLQSQAFHWLIFGTLALALWIVSDWYFYGRKVAKNRGEKRKMILWIGFGLSLASTLAFGIALFLPSGAKTQNRETVEKSGPISWSIGGGHYLFSARSTDHGAEFIGFQITGQNESDQFITIKGGFVRSEITGQKFPILVSDRSNLVDPDGYGIPAHHQFHLGARFVTEGGLSANQILKDFRQITFQFKYDDKTYTRTFSAKEIEAEVERTERDLRQIPPQSRAGVVKIQPK